MGRCPRAAQRTSGNPDAREHRAGGATSAFTAAATFSADASAPAHPNQGAGSNPYCMKIGFAAALVMKSSNFCASGLAPFVSAMG
jgi:hypothetical protein